MVTLGCSGGKAATFSNLGQLVCTEKMTLIVTVNSLLTNDFSTKCTNQTSDRNSRLANHEL